MPKPLTLRVFIPPSDAEECPALLPLARQATMFEHAAHVGAPLYTATFMDVTQSLGQVVQLIGEAVRCRRVRAEIRGRPVVSLIRFWSALLCYRESLDEANPHDHCLRFSARLNQFGGCPDQTCLSPCQFLCTRCIGLAQGKSGASLEAQLHELARQAEADWCPNLGFSDRLLTPDTGRTP